MIPMTELLFRLVLAFIVLLILTRLMGRKEISQMTFFNFVSAISIGTIGASLATDSSISISNGLISLMAWSAFTIFVSFLDLKVPRIRFIVEGQPVIVIKKGEIMEEALRQVRLDLDALSALLRKKDVFAIADVDYAIFEIDGTLSVLKKEPKQTVTKRDFHVQHTSVDVFPIATTVISDGEIKLDNLRKLKLDKEWLERQMKRAGANSISDVFYAEVQRDGTVYFDFRDDTLKE